MRRHCLDREDDTAPGKPQLRHQKGLAFQRAIRHTLDQFQPDEPPAALAQVETLQFAHLVSADGKTSCHGRRPLTHRQSRSHRNRNPTPLDHIRSSPSPSRAVSVRQWLWLDYSQVSARTVLRIPFAAPKAARAIRRRGMNIPVWLGRVVLSQSGNGSAHSSACRSSPELSTSGVSDKSDKGRWLPGRADFFWRAMPHSCKDFTTARSCAADCSLGQRSTGPGVLA
jgi:hypothetical protein